MSGTEYRAKYPYVVRERGTLFGRRYLADPDECHEPWCEVQAHAQRHSHAAAKSAAKHFDAIVVKLVPRSDERGEDR